ncbi:beta propeller repeat protein [Kordiimonas aquimaris]|uniref:hypothetical protein n=1 Tax=Kordiimonas aquimaris TaxID=707591 RepID=UPI0021CF8768|nr:hypothetical protein [Kordiimonas aquimaris]
MRRVGGALVGLMYSVDAGANWTVIDNGGVFRRLHIRAIHAFGNTILVCGNSGRPSRFDGLYMSTDKGQSFDHLSDTKLGRGRSLALAVAPDDSNVLYVHAGHSIHLSSDAGSSWTRASDTSINSRLSDPSNVKIASGPRGSVFVAIAEHGRLSALFHSGDYGTNWDALDLPSTREGHRQFGLHPGGQAGIHFSLAADFDEPKICYIGGDRQPALNEGGGSQSRFRQFPNSSGANTYSGRIFRVDAEQPTGSQATHITHNNTTSNSAPHADSRCMAVAPNGDLIEGDDGGVFCRVDPRSNTGNWKSLIGTLATTEFHSAVWNSATQTITGGAQDNGTLEQDATGANRWPTVTGGDGGVVAVAPFGTSGGTVRYSSYQYLGGARRMFFAANGAHLGTQRMSLRSAPGTSRKLSPQFYSPIQTNRGDPTRLLIGGSNMVWESFDRGDTVHPISPSGVQVNSVAAVAYGADSSPDYFYVGSSQDVFVRTRPYPASMRRASRIGTGESITGLALDPATPDIAFAVCFGSVHQTIDAGRIWVDLTDDLFTVGARVIRSVAWCGNVGGGMLVVGTNSGIYALDAPGLAGWRLLGADLPSVPVMQLQYDDASRVLLAATLGRGAWTMTF